MASWMLAGCCRLIELSDSPGDSASCELFSPRLGAADGKLIEARGGGCCWGAGWVVLPTFGKRMKLM